MGSKPCRFMGIVCFGFSSCLGGSRLGPVRVAIFTVFFESVPTWSDYAKLVLLMTKHDDLILGLQSTIKVYKFKVFMAHCVFEHWVSFQCIIRPVLPNVIVFNKVRS
jgi:hypothetical protein